MSSKIVQLFEAKRLINKILIRFLWILSSKTIFLISIFFDLPFKLIPVKLKR